MSDSSIEGIDEAGVASWFAAQIAGAVPPFRYELIAGGHSNLTFRVQDDNGNVYVLRRPPLGQVLATAHDMEREHRVVSAVGQTAVPVPATLGVCEDVEVNGAPFYVMAYVEGAVLHSDIEAALITPKDRMNLSREVVEVLAELHSVEPDEIALGDLAKREEYLSRQLRRWSRQWEQSKTRELDTMEEVQRLLEQHMPTQIGSTIVHGDYRLGNMLVDSGSIRAVLDWELCTLGDPLADVGYLLNNWVDPDETPAGSSAPTLAGGFATRDQLLKWYERASGRDISQVGYYRAFSYWRLAAIVEGVLNRYLQGAMGNQEDVDVMTFKDQVETLSASALEALSH
ncbi:MAG TPA: phosphotransferase family protein [Acidimicrobiaceae bacterium]|nr:phosphotransferase family protein [Acidimicrobiaceae bacterium]|tara:strand:+ start:29186 stop:30211 length:1026 start_codon:yes stop_codon:yes gene_type:complete